MDTLVKGIASRESILLIGLIDTVAAEKARAIHDTYPTASAALGRVMSAAVLLASMLKENQKVMVQVTGDGPLREVVAESDWLLRVRGYVRRPHIYVGLKKGKLDVGRGVGKGFFNVVKDLGLARPYRGTVPLQTGEIAMDLTYYLTVSEQIPSAVSLGVYVDPDNSVRASGGFMIQALPGSKDETIEYLENRLKEVPPVSSMILDGLSGEEILSRAAGRSFDVIEKRKIIYHCSCSKERFLDSIAALGQDEIKSLIKNKKGLNAKCEFCKARYVISQEELHSILDKAPESPSPPREDA